MGGAKGEEPRRMNERGVACQKQKGDKMLTLGFTGDMKWEDRIARKSEFFLSIHTIDSIDVSTECLDQ